MSLSPPTDRAAAARQDAAEVVSTKTTGQRIASIDVLRGLVMVLMALDHTRDFFGPAGMQVRDVADPALFLTRWITHFCAPLFILLSGTSAFLYGARRTRGALSLFLLTRGLWLIVIEFTLLHVAWTFDLSTSYRVAQVIWAIGASMIVLAGLISLPRWAIAVIAVVMIGGHNLLDHVKPSDFGNAGFVWTILHRQGVVLIGPGLSVYVFYPLVPWIGVMAAGYALGPLFMVEPQTRRRWLLGLGLSACLGFVALRASNIYGDPAPWTVQASPVATVLAFINCEKYPPSLLYFMMTLGPGLILLAAFEKTGGRAAEWLMTFGRVPFFYYVVHIFVIHALAVAFSWASMGDASWLVGGSGRTPASYGLSLPAIYAVTGFVVVLLYPACRWFAAVKQRRTDWWLSYL